MSSGIREVSSSRQRATPDVTDSDLRDLARGNTEFAQELYNELRSEQGNLFFSPYSISLALAMTYAGARGSTAAQVADVLHFGVPQERLHPALNALDQRLSELGEGVEPAEGTGFELNIANSIWGQAGHQFSDDYLDTLAVNYGAGLRLVDFRSRPEESRQLINGWVEDQTQERIKDLIPQGVIDPLTRLVLANAIYFKASWQRQFRPEDTKPGQFTRLDGSSVTTQMMHANFTTGYAENSDLQAVQLHYVGGETSMLILLPKQGRFAEVESALDRDTLEELTGNVSSFMVTLAMPKFSFESRTALKDVLKRMGMTEAFEPPSGSAGADFSGIDGQRDLYIQDALHKAFVAVDEQGTEAAAATAIVVGTTSLPPSATMSVDRPFIFLIVDNATGTVLFQGRVVDPTSQG